MTHVRSASAALALVGLVVLAGCLGPLAQYTAAPATVAADAHEPLGYVAGDVTAVPFDYRIGDGPLSTNVTVTGQVASYGKVVDGNVATFVLFSTPDREVRGESLNPLVRLTDREAVEWTLERVDGLAGFAADASGLAVGDVGSLREVGVTERTILGERTEVVTYAGTATVDGRPTGALVHFAAVEHGEDVILVVGVHAAAFDETANLGALMEQIEHADSSR